MKLGVALRQLDSANSQDGISMIQTAAVALTGADATATDANLRNLVSTGMTINGQQIEFYNSNDGAYKGEAVLSLLR